jgi:hypothetical protein
MPISGRPLSPTTQTTTGPEESNGKQCGCTSCPGSATRLWIALPIVRSWRTELLLLAAKGDRLAVMGRVPHVCPRNIMTMIRMHVMHQGVTRNARSASPGATFAMRGATWAQIGPNEFSAQSHGALTPPPQSLIARSGVDDTTRPPIWGSRGREFKSRQPD